MDISAQFWAIIDAQDVNWRYLCHELSAQADTELRLRADAALYFPEDDGA